MGVGGERESRKEKESEEDKEALESGCFVPAFNTVFQVGWRSF